MMLRRRQRPSIASEAPSNRLLNKLVTYGLILFVIYMVSLSARQQRMVKTNPEYTPINWCNYAEVTNLLTGETENYTLPQNGQLVLKIAAKDLEQIDDKDKNPAVFQVQLPRPEDCDPGHLKAAH